jgi:hydrogenase nickel incorporation protein HypA/HybF
MHELGIAQALVSAAAEESRAAGAERVLAVTVELGALSGVVEHYLRSAYPVAAAGTALQGAELRIERVAGKGWCAECERDFPLSDLLDRCPRCGGFAREIRDGQQLSLVAIDVE